MRCISVPQVFGDSRVPESTPGRKRRRRRRQAPESAIATGRPPGRILIDVEWPSKTVWWVRVVTVGVLVILVAGRECRKRVHHETGPGHTRPSNIRPTPAKAQALWERAQNG